MERGKVAVNNVRKSHTNTSDLLTWSESPATDASISTPSSAAHPSNKAPDGVGKVLFGGQLTEEEAEALNKRKPCSVSKLKEMSGSKIFAGDAEDDSTETGNAETNFSNRTSVRIVQQAANGISQISFSTEEKLSPKKPTTIPEVAKQRELSGTIETESEEGKAKKQLSDAKTKELSGSDIFGPPPEIPARSLSASRTMDLKESKDMGEPVPRTVRTSVKVSNPAGGRSNILFGDEPPEMKSTKKIHNQKFQELTGNDIFKGEATLPGSAEKSLSSAKLKEISGNDIFADGKVESRDYFGGVRKPPGGESSIALI